MKLYLKHKIRCEGTNAVECSKEKDWLLCCAREDGDISMFDTRTNDCIERWSCDEDGIAVTSIAFREEGDGSVCASVGGNVHVYDLRKTSSPCQSHALSQEELNQVVVQRGGRYLGVADDAGHVHVVDLVQNKKHKTMRGGHVNLCSTVAFRPRRSWEILSGGLDCRLVRWDFSRGVPKGAWEMGAEKEGSLDVFNPPMIHSIAVFEEEDVDMSNLVVVARGDGAVGVYDVDVDRIQRYVDRRKKGRKFEKNSVEACKMILGREQGGHRNSVSHLTFGRFETKRFLASGGNDRRIVLWDLSKTKEEAFVLQHFHGKKINWLCCGPGRGTHWCACDVGDDVSVYELR